MYIVTNNYKASFIFITSLYIFLEIIQFHLVMMTESSGNVKSVIFWVHLIFSLIGVSFNIIFIWIIKKTQKRRDQSGVILMTACVCKAMIGVVLFVKAIVLKAWEIQEQHSSFVKVVGK